MTDTLPVDTVAPPPDRAPKALVLQVLADLSGRPRVLAILAGLMLGFAQPPFGFLPGLFGYALLLYALERDLGKKPGLSAFFIGWLAGFGYFFVGCFWVAEAFLVDADTYGWMAPFAATLLPAGMGLFWGLFGVVYRWFARRGQFALHDIGRFLFFASLFSVFEFLRGTVLSGFPWDPSGTTWRAGGAMSQMAAFVGVYGLGFLTVAIFSSVAVLRPSRGLKGFAPAIAAGLLFVLCFGLGEVRLLTTPVTYTAFAVRVVQPNVGQKAKWTQGAFNGIFDDYINLSRAAPAPGHPRPSVIIWPEGALPEESADDLLSNQSWTAPKMIGLLHDRESLIFGAWRNDVDPKRGPVYRNSLIVLQQENGRQSVGAYDKFKLVPFGEFTPFSDALVHLGLDRLGIKALNHLDEGFTPGPRTRTMKFANMPRFLPMICYEAIFPALDNTHYTGSDDPLRPRWIVNISNDAWFGPTTGPLQHLNIASYRAIEEGLPMVRATPTGVSALIDPLGRVKPGEALGLGERGYLDFNLPNPAHLTLFAGLHNTIMIILTLFCCILVTFDTFVSVIKKNLLKSSQTR